MSDVATSPADAPSGTIEDAPSGTIEDAESGPIEFVCPRCQRDSTEAFYGPCSTCRTTLRAVMGGEAQVVEKTDYVPKMNVTPNAVATKD